MRFNKARLSTGLRIHYAESGDARGTPVVFVHGWPDSWFSFSRVLPLLPPTLRLIALDQRGFGTIRAPTRLLWGDHDALFSRAQQDAFLAAVPAARLKVYPETGHCPNWERPEWVAADIADLVAGVTRQGSLE